MSKKTKKQTRNSSTPLAATPVETSSVTTSAFAPSMMTAGRTSDSDFHPDYSATIMDLKRIGILASSFFVVLIILSFFLR
jgi:hypothetical protein